MAANNVVNHPDHYQLGNGMETIDLIEAATDGLEGIVAFDIGNVLKYTCRFKDKEGIQDLKKADWYIQHLIAHLENDVKKKIDEITQGGMLNG